MGILVPSSLHRHVCLIRSVTNCVRWLMFLSSSRIRVLHGCSEYGCWWRLGCSSFPSPHSVDHYIRRLSPCLCSRQFAILLTWLTLPVIISLSNRKTALQAGGDDRKTSLGGVWWMITNTAIRGHTLNLFYAGGTLPQTTCSFFAETPVWRIILDGFQFGFLAWRQPCSREVVYFEIQILSSRYFPSDLA